MSLLYFQQAPVSLVLFVLTIVVSAIALYREDFRDKHTLVPYDMILYKEYWRLFTSGFMHGNFFHLAMNMVTFFFFAFMLEPRLGHWQFLVIYVAGLMISNMAVTLRYCNDTSYEGSVGASGAISALVLSGVICNPYLNFGIPGLTHLFPSIQAPGYLLAGMFVLYSLINMFRKSSLNINHDAHLWGAVSGLALTFVLKPEVVQILARYLGQP